MVIFLVDGILLLWDTAFVLETDVRCNLLPLSAVIRPHHFQTNPILFKLVNFLTRPLLSKWLSLSLFLVCVHLFARDETGEKMERKDDGDNLVLQNTHSSRCTHEKKMWQLAESRKVVNEVHRETGKEYGVWQVAFHWTNKKLHKHSNVSKLKYTHKFQRKATVHYVPICWIHIKLREEFTRNSSYTWLRTFALFHLETFSTAYKRIYKLTQERS